MDGPLTIPVWVLLAFAGWTLVLLLLTVGAFRWGRTLSGGAEIAELQADRVEEQGSDFYRRAMRAHANCIENLPVYAAIVLAIVATGLDDRTLGVLAVVLIAARIVHSTVHVALDQTNVVTSVRFTFFFVQYVCMVWMGIRTAVAAL